MEEETSSVGFNEDFLKSEQHENGYECKECGEMFARQSALTLHTEVHDDLRQSKRLPSYTKGKCY